MVRSLENRGRKCEKMAVGYKCKLDVLFFVMVLRLLRYILCFFNALEIF